MAVIWFTAVGSFFIFRDFRQRFTKNRSPPIEHKGKGNLMKTIKYEINGTFVEIEVSDEFARQYEQIETEEKRVNRKETRRHQSLETLIESGFQIADQESDIEEKTFHNDDIRQLRYALETLTVDQKWLIEQVYFLDRKQSEIAAELGINPVAVWNRLQKIYNKIKKFFQYGG